MQFTSTLSRVYLSIIAIPVLAVVLASGVGNAQSDDQYSDLSDYESASVSSDGGITPDADDYAGLGQYNPCLFIVCDGE